jgi:hypothetical protein
MPIRNSYSNGHTRTGSSPSLTLIHLMIEVDLTSKILWALWPQKMDSFQNFSNDHDKCLCSDQFEMLQVSPCSRTDCHNQILPVEAVRERSLRSLIKHGRHHLLGATPPGSQRLRQREAEGF